MVPLLQIPEPYNFLIQVRFKDQYIYESYFSQFVSLERDGINMINGVHIEVRTLHQDKFEHMPCRLGYDNVFGVAVLNGDGELIYKIGEIDGRSDQESV